MKKYILFLFFITQLPLFSQDNSREVLYCFDFGGAFQKVAPGFLPLCRVYHSPRYLWIDNVSEISRLEEKDPLLRDFVSFPKGEFWVGLDNGNYSITLIMYDPRIIQGPFSIFIQDKLEQNSLTTKEREPLKLSYDVKVTDNKLKIKMVADKGKNFVLNGLIISGEPGKSLKRLFDKAPKDILPTVDELYKYGLTDTKSTLRKYCDWFLSHRLANGFLGDFEPNPDRDEQLYWWYTSAYTIRTLLAAYDIFNDNKYIEAVTNVLDKLVSEQMPNGAWQQTYRNKPTKLLSPADIEDITKNYWMNIADIGSIATSLGASIHYVDESRKSLYTEALRKYCEEWALRWQKPNGGFTNGMAKGIPEKEVYHTATATSITAFTSLYSVTKDEKYLKVAEKAAGFLLDNWLESGEINCYSHHTEQTEVPYTQPVTHFGAGFYYSDGLLMVYHHSKDARLKERIKKVYTNYIKGEKGLLNSLGNNSWWQLQDIWDNSKTAGIPLVFLSYKKMANGPEIERVISISKRFLCTPDFATRIGIMVEDTDLPWGRHSIQGWSGCSMAATGFAGLSIAEMTKPGVIFLTNTR